MRLAIGPGESLKQHYRDIILEPNLQDLKEEATLYVMDSDISDEELVQWKQDLNAIDRKTSIDPVNELRRYISDFITSRVHRPQKTGSSWFKGLKRMHRAMTATRRRAQGAQTPEGSAHPGSPFFDADQASQAVGDLAEEVRGWFSKNYESKPPGLQTISNDDGSITVVADNPESGIGMQAVISLLTGAPALGDELAVGPPPPEPATPPLTPGPGLAVGPPPAGSPVAPPPVPGAAPVSPGMVGPPPTF